MSTLDRLAFPWSPCAALLLLAGCRSPAPPPAPDVRMMTAASVPTDPDDPVWTAVPEHVAPLIPQDLVEPRQLVPTTGQVRVRAVTDGAQVAFRLEWLDPSQDDVSSPSLFCDACAVQMPAAAAPTIPAPQMGEAGQAVEITYWNAAWQAIVDGRGDSIRDLYPNAAIDHYPYDAPPLQQDPAAQAAMAMRYAPARALGNLLAGPRDTPVQDLIAEGPGSTTPAPSTRSTGSGRPTADGWAVVIARRLPAQFQPQIGSQVAFAIWEGGQAEAGGRKMRTGWIPLQIQE